MSAHGFGLGECVGLWIGSHAGLIFCFCVRRQNSLCLLLHLFFGKRWEHPITWRSHIRSATWEEVNWIRCSGCHGKHLGSALKSWGPGAGHLLQKGGIEDQELSVFFVILVQN